ncbi:LLM class flavin-dependent oxidoreductase [Pseudonocardia sp.]|uniref:LLM class flavin-dependent oxidoreductase n=1 Tax=Pseudonocardia sp. TaxID=60912 RepID=UPI003D0C5F40
MDARDGTGPVSRPVPLSVLDLAPVPRGGTAAEALRHTIELARLAEATGYHRYWVAEHHLVSGVASSSTPVLVALVAAATERIRVGSGAVQLPNTPPLLVAEQFGTVAQLHPGRIDVGLGRFDLAHLLARRSGGARPDPPPARVVDGLLVPTPPRLPPGDLTALEALAAHLGVTPGEPSPDYGEQVDTIADLFAGRTVAPGGRPLVAHPADGADVQLWVLGSSAGESARVAGTRGLPFAVSYHIAPSAVLDAVEAYRAAFRPSAQRPEPYVLVSADVVVAPTDERARELAAPYGQWVLGIRTGIGAQPYVTPAEARARAWTADERAAVQDRIDTQVVGSPSTVVERLATLARVTGADELLVTTITTDHADRVRSTELLAKAWAGRSTAAA